MSGAQVSDLLLVSCFVLVVGFVFWCLLFVLSVGCLVVCCFVPSLYAVIFLFY